MRKGSKCGGIFKGVGNCGARRPHKGLSLRLAADEGGSIMSWYLEDVRCVIKLNSVQGCERVCLG